MLVTGIYCSAFNPSSILLVLSFYFSTYLISMHILGLSGVLHGLYVTVNSRVSRNIPKKEEICLIGLVADLNQN